MTVSTLPRSLAGKAILLPQPVQHASIVVPGPYYIARYPLVP